MPRDSLSDRVDRVELMVAGLEQLPAQIATLDGRVAALDGRVATLDGRVAALDGRVQSVETQIVQLRDEMHVECSAVRQEMQAGFASTKAELRAEMRDGFVSITTELGQQILGTANQSRAMFEKVLTRLAVTGKRRAAPPLNRKTHTRRKR